MSAKKSITVWNSGGKQGKVVETSALNWADLKRDLTNAGVSTSGMKAVIGKTKTNLEHNDAILPDDDFTLFLFPEKTRSGVTSVGLDVSQIEALPYSELRSKLKELSEADGQDFKDHFNKDKNYTTKSTADLKALLVSYGKKSGGKSAAKATAPAASKTASKSLPAAKPSTEVAKTKQVPARASRTAVPEPKTEATSTLADTKDSLKTNKQKADFIVDLINDMDNISEYDKNQAVDVIAGLVATGSVKGKSSSSAINSSQLQDEAKEIARGMSGIQQVY